MDKKNVFVILGLGRSGTSAIARAMKVLGIDLGVRLRASGTANPKGFYEDGSVLGINRLIARALSNPWLNVCLSGKMDSHTEKVFSQYGSHAKHIVNNRLAVTNAWAFKDPRTIIFLPFWQSIFSQLNLNDHYVICIRNPVATVNSSQAFSHNDTSMLYIMWLANMIAAIRQTEGKKRIIISYELMIENAQAQIARMKLALDVESNMDLSDLEDYTNHFLDKKLVHFSAQESDLPSVLLASAAPLCLRVYECLMKLARDEIQFDSDVFKNEWRQIETRFSEVYPLYQYVQGITLRNQKLEVALSEIKHSVTGWLTLPLMYLKQKMKSVKIK